MFAPFIWSIVILDVSFSPSIACKIPFLDSSMKYFSYTLSWLLLEDFCFSNDCWHTKAINQVPGLSTQWCRFSAYCWRCLQVAGSFLFLAQWLEKGLVLKANNFPRSCVCFLGKQIEKSSSRSEMVKCLRSWWRSFLSCSSDVHIASCKGRSCHKSQSYHFPQFFIIECSYIFFNWSMVDLQDCISFKVVLATYINMCNAYITYIYIYILFSDSFPL